MKLLWTLVALLLVLAAIAGAQGTIAPAPAPGSTGVIGGGISTAATGTMVVGASFDVGPGSMKGAPFSADVVTETNRQLADGNRIHRETHGKMFRDSEGRTRTENEIQIPTSQPHEHVLIFDPVEKVFISLDARHKTATVNHFQRTTQAPEVPRQAAPVTAPLAPKRPDFKSESLGVRQIEGFNANGTRRTWTVAAGETGNEKPLVTVTEIWTSTELHVTLLSTRDDPLNGQTTRKLVNIQTGEPDPLLFQVPPDYTVKDNSEPK